MKIAICGSFAFAKEMISASEKISEMGYKPILPSDVMTAIRDPTISRNIEWCIEKDVIRDQLFQIMNADAILVLNYEKDGVPGYIGGSTLIELGFAHFFNKKIFLLYPIPNLSYSVEIQVMRPVILYGDLSKIKQAEIKSGSDQLPPQ